MSLNALEDPLYKPQKQGSYSSVVAEAKRNTEEEIHQLSKSARTYQRRSIYGAVSSIVSTVLFGVHGSIILNNDIAQRVYEITSNPEFGQQIVNVLQKGSWVAIPLEFICGVVPMVYALENNKVRRAYNNQIKYIEMQSHNSI